MFFIVLLGKWNHKLININYDLMKDNKNILIKLNDIYDKLPTMTFVDTPTGRIFERTLKKD